MTLFKTDEINFSIRSIDKNWEYEQNKLTLERRFKYKFMIEHTINKTMHEILLNISFSPNGYTTNTNILIVNFGYDVEIRKWSNRTCEFEWCQIDSDNGKGNKHILIPETRIIINKFVQHFMKKYLQEINPRIIYRGVLNNFKTKSKRYLDLDNVLYSFNYEKQIFLASKNKSLSDIACVRKKKEDTKIWCYSKYTQDFKELKSVVKI